MRELKYIGSLEPFLHLPLFTACDAVKAGIPRHALAYLVKKGILVRIYAGVYRSSLYEPVVDFEWENLALIADSIPNATICLVSALCYYNLTDQIMRESWIAIPHRSFAPKRPYTRIIRMRNTRLGRIEIQLGEFKVHIFDRERTVVDAFRYLGTEIAIKALQLYLQDKKNKPQIKKLARYAKILRVNISPYILSLTT